jgi:hypothetical protein
MEEGESNTTQHNALDPCLVRAGVAVMMHDPQRWGRERSKRVRIWMVMLERGRPRGICMYGPREARAAGRRGCGERRGSATNACRPRSGSGAGGSAARFDSGDSPLQLICGLWVFGNLPGCWNRCILARRARSMRVALLRRRCFASPARSNANNGAVPGDGYGVCLCRELAGCPGWIGKWGRCLLIV